MIEALQAPINIITRQFRKQEPVDLIVKYYREQEAQPLKPLPSIMPNVLSTVTMGLGDTMMLTDLPKAAAKQYRDDLTCFSGSPHFLPIMSFNPFWKQQKDKAFMVNAPDLVRQYDCGNGHYLQRIRRAFGLKVDDCPRGCIKWKGRRNPNRVILHFEPGIHVNWQRKEIHPKARHLYPETQLELERFIAQSKKLHFVQLGSRSLHIKGTSWVRTNSTVELVEQIALGSWFIGIMSGPMHVATALQLKCVVVINFPDPDKIFPPTLKVINQVESEWFYPQHVHLHQDGEGPLVPKATCRNFHAAFNGEAYPFWSQSYLSLIHERL